MTIVEAEQVTQLSVEPGELPDSMSAWVVRKEREGQPADAYQLEQVEVPEPGPYEVIVRVMAAGVNFNGIWAALGKPVSVFDYGDHPQYGHHIGGSDGSGVVWKVGEGIDNWKPGDEVILYAGHYSYEDIEVHGFDPMAARSFEAWGYETTWGSFAQFAKVQAHQLLPRPQSLSWVESAAYGLSYFTAYRLLVERSSLQVGQKVLVWGAAGGLGVFAVQLAAAAGADVVGVVNSPEKGRLIEDLGAVGWVDRSEFDEMMRTAENLSDRDAEKRRTAAMRAFAKRVKAILGEEPDIVVEHVGKATFPTSVFSVKPFGKVAICGATTGFNLDFDARYLWMRQKEIVGCHGVNPYQAMKANKLVHAGKIRPLLWETRAFGEVAAAHQMMLENKHLGKIAILVGADNDEAGRKEPGPGAIRASRLAGGEDQTE
jgi:crotonyl-CoA carboxylase/reductase